MTLLAEIKIWMEADEWPVQYLPEQGILLSLCTTENGDIRCQVVTEEETGIVCFYTVPTISLPEERRTTMMTLLTLINFDLPLGNFEMDLTDGYIRFKSSMDVDNVGISEPLVRNLIMAAVMCTDRFLPAIRAIETTQMTAEEALLLCEDEDSDSEDPEE